MTGNPISWQKQSLQNSMNALFHASNWDDPEGWDGEGGSGCTHVQPWLIHVNVWQKPLQYCKVISLQIKLINYFFKKNSKKTKSRQTTRRQEVPSPLNSSPAHSDQ